LHICSSSLPLESGRCAQNPVSKQDQANNRQDWGSARALPFDTFKLWESFAEAFGSLVAQARRLPR